MSDTSAKVEHRMPGFVWMGLILVLAAVSLYWAAYWIALAASPLGYDVDFNNDGNVSLLEAFDGATIHSKKVVIDGRSCVDYFEPKTGSQWRLICDRP